MGSLFESGCRQSFCYVDLGVVSGLHIVFVSLYLYTPAMPYDSMRLLFSDVTTAQQQAAWVYEGAENIAQSH